MANGGRLGESLSSGITFGESDTENKLLLAETGPKLPLLVNKLHFSQAVYTLLLLGF